jgi:uncharacterized protein involved in tellurium resistance
VRRFYLIRHRDETGTSGHGAVCEGVQLSDGKVVLVWIVYLHSISMYDSIEDVITIHGHDGATELVWVDDEPSYPPVATERPPGWDGDDYLDSQPA